MLEEIYEWDGWVMLLHVTLSILITYIFYLLFINPKDRNVTNFLLLAIVLAIDILVHQNINKKNKKLS